MFTLNFKGKSLNSILEGFTKTIDELKEFVSTKEQDNITISEELQTLGKQLESNIDDINRANSAINNIKNIIGN